MKYRTSDKDIKFKKMQTNILSLRNVVTIVICLAVLSMFVSCEKNGKIEVEKELSPPQWIQGEWEYDGIVCNVYFKFTSDNVIFSLPYGIITSFSDLYEDKNYSIEETKKTNEIYEITVTRNNSKKISKFTREDNGNHIQYYLFDTELEGLAGANDAIYILHKK